MISPNYKIKVFISSACGNDRAWKEKYNIVRAGLKVMIESTGLADVYLFEAEEASTISAELHYTSALSDCDVCIFLIDNFDGVPSGVQIEIDMANKHRIKSLYYFCDQNSKKETPLQKSLMGAKFAKSKVVHSFEQLIVSGTQGLIDDLTNIYRSYSKGRIDFISENNTYEEDVSIAETYFQTSLVATKDVTSNIDKTKSYFSRFILGSSDEIQYTSIFDDWCCRFFPVMFEQKSIVDFNLDLFIKELKKLQTEQFHVVAKKRWEAIQLFFLGELEGTIPLLNEALKLAKECLMPDWIIKDILIDLRNQKNLLEESRNHYWSHNDAQIEIEQSTNPLHYPLLDRFDSDLHSNLVGNALKQKIESPYTVTLGGNLKPYVNNLSNIYIVAMFNGSLTQLMVLYQRIKFVAFHLSERYTDWHFRRLLLKTAIINYKTKEINGIINSYEEILCKMNDMDAREIFDFSKNRPVPHQKFICNLEAFKVVGYFLNDADFEVISKEMIDQINSWIQDDNRNIAVGSHIFDSLSGVAFRLQQDDLASVLCKLIDRECRRWYDDIFKLVANHINLNNLSEGVSTELLDKVISIVRDEKERSNIHTLEQALYSLRKTNKELTEQLNEAIKINMDMFYNATYKLETSDVASIDMPDFIQKYIGLIHERNKSQGLNGQYTGYIDRPHVTIKLILKHSKITFENDLLDSIFTTAGSTLLAEKQTIEEKCDAIDLIVYLCKRYTHVIERNVDMIGVLESNKETIQTGNSTIMSTITESSLRISSLLLYSCFGNDIGLQMIESLHLIDEDIPSLVQISKTILSMLEANEQMKVATDIETVLLQFALKCSNSINFNVRMYGIQILFQLLRNPNSCRIICNQLVKSIDIDTGYIKNIILRKAYLIKSVDIATYNYILQKASLDTNYAVRKVYSEVIQS